MEFNVENVERALVCFYKDPMNQAQANTWLTAFQVSPSAWTVSWQLLDLSKPPEVQHFGASCLHMKASRFLFELQPNEIENLRQKLIELLLRFSKGPKLVLTKVCVTLAGFVVATAGHIWKDVIVSLMQTLRSDQVDLTELERCTLLLELLRILPEEFGSQAIPAERKSAARNELQNGVPHILALLQNIFSGGQMATLHEGSLRCLASWAVFGIPLPDLMQFAQLCFQALDQEPLFDAAVDCLVAIFSCHENYRYPASLQQLYPLVSLQRARITHMHSESDIDGAQAMTRLVVAAAESSPQLLLQLALNEMSRNVTFDLMTSLLVCCTAPGFYPVDELSSDLAFGFWYILQDEILASSESPVTMQYQALFQPVYMALVEVFLRKVQYPPDDQWQNWSPDEKEAHRCYRQDIADSLMYEYALLGDQLLGRLSRAFHEGARPEGKWQEVEAALYGLAAIAEAVDEQEQVHLKDIFAVIGGLDLSRPEVASQAMEMMGAYADWLQTHPAFFNHLIPILLKGLKDPQTAQDATIALKDLLYEFEALQPAQCAHILHECRAALDVAQMHPRDASRLMACVALALSALPQQETAAHLDALVAPRLAALRESLCRDDVTDAAAQMQLQWSLNMMAWFYGSLVCDTTQALEQQPCGVIMREMLPLLQQFAARWAKCDDVISGLVELLKRVMRSMMDLIKPISQQLISLLLQLYQLEPHASLVDLAKHLLLLLSPDAAYRQHALELLSAVCTCTMTLREDELRALPDLCDHFMVMLAHCAKKNTHLLEAQQVDLRALMNIGLVCISAAEATASKAACAYFCEVVAAGQRSAKVKDAVLFSGQNLLRAIVMAVAGASPRACAEQMADVLHLLNKHEFEALGQWFNGIIAEEGFPTPKCTRTQKEQFARRVLSERTNKRRTREIVVEYTLIWRGMFGSEYAAQTTPH